MRELLALDFGASSGRAISGCFENGKIELIERYRFSNDPVMLKDVFYWDFLRLFHEIKQSLVVAKQRNTSIESIGIDTWGVDVGFLNANGDLLENPRHYRNTLGSGAKNAVLDMIPAKKLYELTGLEFAEFNTIFQIYQLGRIAPDILKNAKRMLFTPDLFGYFLTGNARCEYTIATTSQLLNIHSRQWDNAVLDTLGLSCNILPTVIKSGSLLGELSPSIVKEIGVETKVIATASHDTHSAFAAAQKDMAVISCGTWSLIGREIEKPVLSDAAFKHGFSNEGTLDGKYNLIKSITGLWVLQEIRRQWKREGSDYSFAQLQEMGEQAEAFCCLIDLDAPEFATPGEMPKKIRDYAIRTKQTPPETVGSFVRAIMESLALKYRWCLSLQSEVCGISLNTVQIVGGGAQDSMLCEFTASATGCTIYAGPVEATAIGNLIVQAISLGIVKNLDDGRQMIKNSFPMKEYRPTECEKWNMAYKQFCTLMKAGQEDRN